MRCIRIVSALCTALGLVLTCQSAQAGGWGTIKGKITYGGKDIPTNPLVTTVPETAKEVCCAKGGPHTDEWVVNSKNGGVRFVLVWLAPASGTDPANLKHKLPIKASLKNPPSRPETIGQPLCEFIPHMVAVREKQAIVAKNDASVPHNVHWQGLGSNPGGNVLLAAGTKHTIKGLKAQAIPVVVTCDIHPWMKAYVGVFNHPYYAVTDKDGNFEIKDAPAGNFRLMVWQESVGWGVPQGKKGMPVTVKADSTIHVDLKLQK